MAVGGAGECFCLDATTGKELWRRNEEAQPCAKYTDVICVLNGSQVRLFAAENGKRLAGPLAADSLKGGTSLAVAGDSLVTRGTKAVVCYKAQRSSQESKP